MFFKFDLSITEVWYRSKQDMFPSNLQDPTVIPFIEALPKSSNLLVTVIDFISPASIYGDNLKLLLSDAVWPHAPRGKSELKDKDSNLFTFNETEFLFKNTFTVPVN